MSPKCTAPKTGQHKSPTAAAACPACTPSFGRSLAGWEALAPTPAPGMPLSVRSTGDAIANFEDSAWEPVGDATVTTEQHERMGTVFVGAVELQSAQYPDQVMISEGRFWVDGAFPDGDVTYNTIVSVSFRDKVSGVTGPKVELNDPEALVTEQMPWHDGWSQDPDEAARRAEAEAAKIAHYTHLMTNGEPEAEMLAWASTLAKYGIDNAESNEDQAMLKELGLDMTNFMSLYDLYDTPMPTQEQVKAALAARA